MGRSTDLILPWRRSPWRTSSTSGRWASRRRGRSRGAVSPCRRRRRWSPGACGRSRGRASRRTWPPCSSSRRAALCRRSASPSRPPSPAAASTAATSSDHHQNTVFFRWRREEEDRIVWLAYKTGQFLDLQGKKVPLLYKPTMNLRVQANDYHPKFLCHLFLSCWERGATQVSLHRKKTVFF